MKEEDHSHSYSHLTELHKKKRVGKACDSCRLKKTKCNGKQPCERCILDNKICIYTERKKVKDKVYSSEYVELIDKRLKLSNKSLLKLCEFIKLSNISELAKFKNNLEYNANDEISPISVNQAISLLVDEDMSENESNDCNTAHHIGLSETKNDSICSTNSSATLVSHGEQIRSTEENSNYINSQQLKIVPPVLPSENGTKPSKRSIAISSPESLSPHSEMNSPTLNSSNRSSMNLNLEPNGHETYSNEDNRFVSTFDAGLGLTPLDMDYELNIGPDSNLGSPVGNNTEISMFEFNSLFSSNTSNLQALTNDSNVKHDYVSPSSITPISTEFNKANNDITTPILMSADAACVDTIISPSLSAHKPHSSGAIKKLTHRNPHHHHSRPHHGYLTPGKILCNTNIDTMSLNLDPSTITKNPATTDAAHPFSQEDFIIL